MSEASNNFAWPVRVYYENTDAGGVVYHAEYLKFFERARTEWLRSLGYEQTEMRERFGLIFVIRNANVHYRRPALFNDELQVLARVAKLGRSSLEFEQEIRRGEDVLVSAHVIVACVAVDGFKPAGMPEQMRNRIRECV